MSFGTTGQGCRIGKRRFDGYARLMITVFEQSSRWGEEPFEIVMFRRMDYPKEKMVQFNLRVGALVMAGAALGVTSIGMIGSEANRFLDEYELER